MTAAQLATQLEVSVRTIHRDLAALSAAGVPVYAEPGRYGGCRLVDGYRTRLTGLNVDEAEALFLAGAPGPLAELGLGTVLAAAQLKVLAALPPELRSRAVRVQERFHLDAPAWFRDPDDVPLLAEVAAAVWDDRRLDVRYARPDRVVRRALDPLGLVLKAGVWYLVARNRGHVRTYRVSRLASVIARSEPFERPAEFDLTTYWSASSVQFEEQMLRLDVTARLSPAGVGMLRRVLEPAAGRAALAALAGRWARTEPGPGPERAGEPAVEPAVEPGGWVEVVMPMESLEVAFHELLRLGAEVEVLAPVELRERLMATAHAMSARYGAA
jgi:predicted DNA-binding transcriptional regulator YafY